MIYNIIDVGGIERTSGHQFRLTDQHMRSVSASLALDPLSEQLSIDTLTFIVYAPRLYVPVEWYDANLNQMFDQEDEDILVMSGVSEDDFVHVKNGTPVYWWNHYDGETGNDTYDHLKGLYYWKTLERVSKDFYKVTCQSAMGILANSNHNGGMYTGATVRAVVDSIFANTGISFALANDVEDALVYGWLPIQTRRDALHQVLFALGLSVSKAADGTLIISHLSTASTPVSASQIFYGGSVEYAVPCSEVQVTEHSFFKKASDEEIALYDNTDGSGTASNLRVEFSQAPIHSIRTTGTMTVSSYNCNYAVVSGTGTLLGKRYSHLTNILSKKNTGVDNKVVNVKNAYLVNTWNSRNVLQRVFDVYTASKSIKMDIIPKDIKPGDLISFTDPFGSAASGIIKSMGITGSRLTRAEAKILCGYTPGHFGNVYKFAQVIPASSGVSEVVVPGNVNELKAVVIGGGQGGTSGLNGGTAQKGAVIDFDFSGAPGGEAGAGGEPGKVYSSVMPSPAGRTYHVTFGTGGAGGVADGSHHVPGSTGTPTKFGTLDSDYGAVPANGISLDDMVTVYGLVGEDGVNGAQGGEGARTGYASQPGGNVEAYSGGSGGTDYDSPTFGKGYGGGGGGAAYGSNGNAGGNGRADNTGSWGGNGGDGADASAPAKQPVFGSGGDGGHGGGGGGGRGYAAAHSEDYPYNPGDGGNGGLGSNGGEGGDGCLILYSDADIPVFWWDIMFRKRGTDYEDDIAQYATNTHDLSHRSYYVGSQYHGIKASDITRFSIGSDGSLRVKASVASVGIGFPFKVEEGQTITGWIKAETAGQVALYFYDVSGKFLSRSYWNVAEGGTLSINKQVTAAGCKWVVVTPCCRTANTEAIYSSAQLTIS